jgi:predicted alpha/beta superfamily hydrolase
MHDGQNLFDAELSFSGVAWGIDEAVEKLLDEGRIHAPLVVGIWNAGARRNREYMPQKPLVAASKYMAGRFSRSFGGPAASDAYIKFLVEELKPFIDATYRTQPGRAHTFIMGSSMGGLISLYALCEYPQVFGGAACLSTSWTVAGRVMVPYLRRTLPAPGSHRLYFDYGNEAHMASYKTYQLQVDRLLASAGFRRPSHWITRHFAGADHSERAWRERVDIPLRFLLRKRPRRDR